MGHEFYKALITDSTETLALQMTEHIAKILGFEVTKPHLVEVNQNRHDFAHGQSPGTLTRALAVGTQRLIPLSQKGLAKPIDMVEKVE